MRPLQPRRHTRAGIPPRIHDVFPIMMFRLVQQSLQARLRETPRTRIQRFFLSPDDSLGVGVLVEVLAQLGPGEGVQLFDAGDGGVFEFVLGAMFVEGDVDLAGAEDDAVDFFWRGDFVGFVGGVGDDPLKVGLAGEVFNGGASERVAEEGFREEENQCCFMTSVQGLFGDRGARTYVS